MPAHKKGASIRAGRQEPENICRQVHHQPTMHPDSHWKIKLPQIEAKSICRLELYPSRRQNIENRNVSV
jgi:hypothetical protein